MSKYTDLYLRAAQLQDKRRGDPSAFSCFAIQAVQKDERYRHIFAYSSERMLYEDTFGFDLYTARNHPAWGGAFPTNDEVQEVRVLALLFMHDISNQQEN